VQRGDTVIIIAYQSMSEEAAHGSAPKKVFVDAFNRIKNIEYGDGFAHNPRAAAVAAR
jgi:aspartate 1-decarboxylase